MKRRQFIAGLASGAVAWPLVGSAQQPGKLHRIGLLWDSPGMFPMAIEAFRGGLRELGWVEGLNVTIEGYWTDGKFERIDEIAHDLARSGVDVIVAPSSIYSGAAKRATSTIPIIFFSHADPLGSGHVASLGHPGGNITGLSLLMTETNAKGLALLKEAVPGLTTVAVLWDPATPSHIPGLSAVETTAGALRIQVQSVPTRSTNDFAKAFSAMSSARADAVLVLSTPLFIAAAAELAGIAINHNLPTLFGPREHAEAGGLISYGPDRAHLWRRGASYVDKVLRGANPAELPVQQPTKYELTINLKTAKTLGLTIPESLLARADEVIE
jgi:putative tryptophan/tyrosine transport system substrate-binding protein